MSLEKNSNPYVNRELSWLRFNERVLEEAEDSRLPLFERMRFIAIFGSNLDEFFMVRVGSLIDQMIVSKNVKDNKTGMTAKEQIQAIEAGEEAKNDPEIQKILALRDRGSK